MTFEAILPALRAGGRARRTNSHSQVGHWKKCNLRINDAGKLWCDHCNLEQTSSADLLATDWELVEEPAPSGHHPNCAQVPGYCGDKCDPKAVARTQAATITRLTLQVETLQSANRSYAKELTEAKAAKEPQAERFSVCTCPGPAGGPHDGCPALYSMIARAKGEATRLTRELAEAQAMATRRENYLTTTRQAVSELLSSLTRAP